MLRLPPLPIQISYPNAEETKRVATEPVRIEVVSMLAEQMRPQEGEGESEPMTELPVAKPAQPVRSRTVDSDLIWWLLGGLGLLLLAGVVAWVLLTRKWEKDEAIRNQTKVPAHVIALAKLAELEEKNLLAAGKYIDYHFSLSLILREYLENRYEFNALESTTFEIIDVIRQGYFPGLDPRILQEILDGCDMVKFARWMSPQEHARQMLLRVRELVHHTKLETMANGQSSGPSGPGAQHKERAHVV